MSKLPDRCYICGDEHSVVLHEHHLVPPRFGGHSDPRNVYHLCANCHQAVSKMYDAEFFDRIRDAPDPDEA